MSYSISVSAKNERLRDEMYEFLQRNYKPWFEVLCEDEDLDSFIGPFIDGDLGGEGSCRIGFEYEPGDLAEREYHFTLMRWVARHVGKRRSRFRSEGPLPQSVPFLQFSRDSLPIFFLEEWTDGKCPGPLIDRLGMRIDDRVVREMAWLCLPDGTFEKVTATHFGRPPEDVQEAIIAEGIEAAHEYISVVRSQLARLDTLWNSR